MWEIRGLAKSLSKLCTDTLILASSDPSRQPTQRHRQVPSTTLSTPPALALSCIVARQPPRGSDEESADDDG